MSDLKLKIEDLDWSRKSPCKDCPFLKTSKFHEGIASNLIGYGDSFDEHRFMHTCHKTDNNPQCDGANGKYKGEKPQHCAGAILMQLKSGNQVPFQNSLMTASIRGLMGGKNALLYMARRAQKDERVFTWHEMLKFYSDELKKYEETNENT